MFLIWNVFHELKHRPNLVERVYIQRAMGIIENVGSAFMGTNAKRQDYFETDLVITFYIFNE